MRGRREGSEGRSEQLGGEGLLEYCDLAKAFYGRDWGWMLDIPLFVDPDAGRSMEIASNSFMFTFLVLFLILTGFNWHGPFGWRCAAES